MRRASTGPTTRRSAICAATLAQTGRSLRRLGVRANRSVCALRRATGFPLDDLTLVVTHFLPHLNSDAVYRILKAEGLNRLPAQSRSRKPDGAF